MENGNMENEMTIMVISMGSMGIHYVPLYTTPHPTRLF